MGGGVKKMSVFVHAQGIKTVHAGGWVKIWKKSVHVVVECPLIVRLQRWVKNTEQKSTQSKKNSIFCELK